MAFGHQEPGWSSRTLVINSSSLEYDITIKHRPGKVHQTADALSQIPADTSVSVTYAKVETDVIPKKSYQDIRDRQRSNPSLAAIINYLGLRELPALSSKAQQLY